MLDLQPSKQPEDLAFVPLELWVISMVVFHLSQVSV